MAKKISILIISLIFMLIGSVSSVMGYNLKLSADLSTDEEYVEFYTIVRASQNAIDTFGNRTELTFMPVPERTLASSSEYYDIMGIIFHKEPLSNYNTPTSKYPIDSYGVYTSSNNKNVINVDTYSKEIKLGDAKNNDGSILDQASEILLYFNENGNQKAEVAQKKGLYYSDMYQVGKSEFLKPDFTLYTISKDQQYVIYRYKFEKSLLYSGELDEFITGKDTDNPYVYVSFVTQTKDTGMMYTAYDFYNNVFNNQALADINTLSAEVKTLEEKKVIVQESIARLENMKVNGYLPTESQEQLDDYLWELDDIDYQLDKKMVSLKDKIRKLQETTANDSVWHPYTKGIDWSGNYIRGYAAANDYDNILYLKDVLNETKDKTLYVNYLEEMKSGDLSVLYVAPKEQPNEHQISLDGGSTYENITLSKYKDYVIETNSNEYEEYKIPVEDKKKKMRFIYMTEAELNAKMNKDIEDEEEQYKYKYIKLKYLTGNTGEKYDILRDKILNGEGKVLTSKKAIKSIDDTKNFLISFIYKNTKQKNKIDILVQHQDKYKNPLPIADGGNQYYEEGESVEKEKDSNKWITHYKGNAKKDNAYTELLVSEYTIEESEKVYKFKGKVKLEAYKTGSEKPDFTKNFHNQNAEKFIFSTSGFANQGYSKVVITYIYETEDTPPSGDDGELKVCPILSFTSTSNLSTTRDTCESKFDFSQKNECSEGETALYLPTGKEFNANIETEKYYVDEKFGIIQKITSTTAEVRILIEYTDIEFKEKKCCDLGNTSIYSGKKTYTIDSPELEGNKSIYNMYKAMANKNDLHQLGRVLSKDGNEVKSVKQLKDVTVEETVSATVGKSEGCKDKNGNPSKHCHGSGPEYTETQTFAVFRVTYIKTEIVGFKSYYLGEIIFDNVYGDGTKFVDKNQRHSILEESINDFDIDYYKDDMVQNLRSKYETNGFVSTAYCGGEGEDGEWNCEGWLTTNTTPAQAWGDDYTGPNTDSIGLVYQYKENDQYSLGIMSNIYAFNMVGLSEINKAAHASIKSRILNTLWDKYNGERLSIAKLTYHNYNWNYKQDLENSGISETNLNQIPVLVQHSNKNPFEIEVKQEKNETTGGYETEYTLKIPRLFDFDEEINGIKKADGSYEKKGLCSDGLDKYLELSNNDCSSSNSQQAQACGESIKMANQSYKECIGDKLPTLTGKTKEELKELYGINTPTTSNYFSFELGNAYFNPIEDKSGTISGLQTLDNDLINAILGRSDLYTVEEATNNKEVSTNSSGINIMNPAALDSIYVDSTRELVSQTLGNDKTFELQVGAETTIVPKISVSDPYNLTLDERKNYIGYYVYEFNFPVEITSGNTINGKKFEADTPVIIQADTAKRSNNNMEYSIDEISNDDYYDYGGMIKFIPTGELASKKNNEQYLTSKVNIETDTIYCTAVANNVPAGDIYNYYMNRIHKKTDEEIKMYVGISQLCNDKNTSSKYTNNTYLTTLENKLEIRKDSRYFSKRVSLSTANISRLYEFRITDCTDVNFKNVFRVNSADTVNKHSGIVYFGGIRSIDIYNNVSKYIKENGVIKQNQNIMPLGPYKNTNKTYVEAPKLGYRISFDLKTSGSYRPDAPGDRTIIIFPKLYYISKDGKEFRDDVKAYYKDSTGKYVKIDQETDLLNKQTYINAAENKKTYNSYQITYIPNDGYRNVLSVGITNREDWFTKDRKTLNMSAIKLENAMMCTNNDGFIQTWYGEYKLPNSTILLREEETNLNNYLKDGYCGVVFYIGVVEIRSDSTVVMCYNTNDKKDSRQYNTTEWDHEGFLGFKQSNIGSKLQGTLNLQLAKGIWNIDDDTYQKIKGTVLLYDLDNRAASDFD